MEQNLFSALMFHVNEDFSLHEVILKFHWSYICGRIAKLAVIKVVMQQSAAFADDLSMWTKIFHCIK